MISYFGDFAEDDTVLIPFNTFDSNDPSASVTITNLAAADIKVHKDGSVTQIATDGATVAIDFDTITGNHLVTIDTSVHADYATGSEYAVRIEGTTVDGATINAWIGAFSIERAGGVLALIKAGNLSSNVVQIGGSTQSATDLKDFADAGYDPATNKVQGVVLVDTTTTNTDMVGTDSAALATDMAKVPKSDGTVSWNATALAAINAEADTAISDASLATAANLATVDANVDAILVDTGTTLDTKLNDIQGATFSGATDSLEAIRNRGDAAWTTGGGGSNPTTLQNTTIATLASQTSFTLTAGSADNSAYVGMLAIITDSATSTQKAVGVVSAYTGSTKTVTLREDPAIFTMATGDTIDIVAVSPDILNILADTNELQGDWANGGRLDLLLDAIPTTAMRGTDNAATAANLATVDANVDAILVDTADMQPKLGTPAGTDISADIADIPTVSEFNARTLAAASYFDPAADTVANVTLVATTTTNTDMRGTDSAATAANLATVDTSVDNLNLGIIYGTAATGTLSTTQATSDLTGYLDSELVGRAIIFTGGTADGQASDITAYASASGLLTFTAITTAPANNDTFKIV